MEIKIIKQIDSKKLLQEILAEFPELENEGSRIRIYRPNDATVEHEYIVQIKDIGLPPKRLRGVLESHGQAKPEEIETDDILQGFTMVAKVIKTTLATIKKEGNAAREEIEIAKKDVIKVGEEFKLEAERQLADMENTITGRLNTQDENIKSQKEQLTAVEKSITILDEFKKEMETWRANLMEESITILDGFKTDMEAWRANLVAKAREVREISEVKK